MYPAQTSLIPAQIALARFWEEGCNIFGPYPYWYLGTTPYRYLTGPILPLALTALHKFLPRLSLFEIIFGLIGAAWVFGGLGVYRLVKELGGKQTKGVALVGTFFYLFGPFLPFLFRFSDGLSLLSFSLVPWTLLFYLRMLKDFKPKTALAFGGLLVFVFLLNMAVVPSLLVGLAIMFLAKVGWEKAEEKLKGTLLVLGLAFLGVTFWYTPRFWLVSLAGPSLAGKPRLEVIFQLAKLLPTAFALGSATVSVKFFKTKNLLRDFCFYWLFVFGFLTLMRLIADPDFWLDWSSYYLELQIGLAVLGGLVVGRLSRKYQKLICVFSIWFLVFSFTFNKYVLGTLQKDITKTVEYRIGKKLSEFTKPGEKVFLSGTTAFWLNAFFDVPQLRGGVDQASVHPTWRKAAWEIREGTNPEESLRWLHDLKISWLIVHTPESEEYYHDFTYPEKFEESESLKKVDDEKGDKIYQVLDKI